jgi:hypothetical protein
MIGLLEAAHKKCGCHRDEILRSDRCGCFYCKRIFASSEVVGWCDTRGHPDGVTAICPYCSIDSVLGDASGFDITAAFLEAMHQRWFK